MKKIFCVFIVIASLALSCSKKPKIEVAPFPAGAAVYGYMINPQESWSKLKASQLYQQVSKLDLWNDPAVKEAFSKVADQKEDNQPAKPPMIETILLLCGNRVDFALMPTTPKPSLVAFSDLGIQATAVKAAGMLQEQFTDYTVQKEPYQKFEITLYSHPEKGTFSYCFIDRYLILSNEAQAIKSCIDVIEKKTPAIFTDANLTGSLATYKDIQNYLYVDVAVMSKLIETTTPDKPDMFRTDQLKFISAGFNYDETGLKISSRVAARDEATIKNWFGEPADIGRTLQYIPENSIFAWVNSLNMSELTKKLEASTEQETDTSNVAEKILESFLASAKEKAGAEAIDKLIPLLKAPMFLAMHDLNTQGMFPVPELVYGIAVTDEDAVKSVMAELETGLKEKMEVPYLEFTSKMIDDVDFRNVSLPLGQNLNPGYSVTDGFLLLAISSTGMENTLSAASNKIKSLPESEKYKKLASPIQKGTVGFQYFNSEILFLKLHDIVNNYRMFFPETINPDHVRDGLKSMAMFQGYYSGMETDKDYLYGSARILIQ